MDSGFIGDEQAVFGNDVTGRKRVDVHGKSGTCVKLSVVVHAAAFGDQAEGRRESGIDDAVAGQRGPAGALCFVRVVCGIDHNGDLVGFGQNATLGAEDRDVHDSPLVGILHLLKIVLLLHVPLLVDVKAELKVKRAVLPSHREGFQKCAVRPLSAVVTVLSRIDQFPVSRQIVALPRDHPVLHVVVARDVKGRWIAAGIIIYVVSVRRAGRLHERLKIAAVLALLLGSDALEVRDQLNLVKQLARAGNLNGCGGLVIGGNFQIFSHNIRAGSVVQPDICGIAVFIHAAVGVV